MNSYTELTTLKSKAYLSIEGADLDAYLVTLIEQASRTIDKFCERHFYCENTTKYYDGVKNHLFTDDILSVTTLKTDTDADAVFETTIDAADYFLLPHNNYPKTEIELNYYGTVGSLAAGITRAIQIAGVFGHGDGVSDTPYLTSGGTGTIADDVGTALTLSVAGIVIGGQTILCESEQMYVSSVTDTTATVIRGVNGTTAAAHTTKTLYIYQYPSPIVQATLITAMRAFKRKDSAYQDAVGSPEIGELLVYKGLDADVKAVLQHYRKMRLL